MEETFDSQGFKFEEQWKIFKQMDIIEGISFFCDKKTWI